MVSFIQQTFIQYQRAVPEPDTATFQKNLSFEIITAITCFEKNIIFVYQSHFDWQGNGRETGKTGREKLKWLTGTWQGKILKQTPEAISVRVGWLQTEGSPQPDWRLSSANSINVNT